MEKEERGGDGGGVKNKRGSFASRPFLLRLCVTYQSGEESESAAARTRTAARPWRERDGGVEREHLARACCFFVPSLFLTEAHTQTPSQRPDGPRPCSHVHACPKQREEGAEALC